MHFDFTDKVLLHIGLTSMFRPLRWPSSGWWKHLFH